jgi:hypothetical protein
MQRRMMEEEDGEEGPGVRFDPLLVSCAWNCEEEDGEVVQRAAENEERPGRQV